MRKNEQGYIGAILLTLLVIGFLFLILFVRFQASNDTSSGVAYNVSNDNFISGSTYFSIRAGENTPVTEENQSTYCLPKGSPYIDLVNKAAQDKRIKVVITADKYFAIQAPWTCYPNVKVTEVK